MKTIEFKVRLTDEQKETFDSWAETLRLVWNQGLELLLELDTYSKPFVIEVPIEPDDEAVKLAIESIKERIKSLGSMWNRELAATLEPILAVATQDKFKDLPKQKLHFRAPCCSIPWDYRWMKGHRWEYVKNEPTKGEKLPADAPLYRPEIVEGKDDDWAAIPYTRFALKRPYRMFCPLQPSTSSSLIFSENNIQHNPKVWKWLEEEGVLPSVTWQAESIKSAWEKYQTTQKSETFLDMLTLKIGKNELFGFLNQHPDFVSQTYTYPPVFPHETYREPRLDQPSNFSLAKWFAQKRHPKWTALHEVPSWFVRGSCHSLSEAWDRFKARKAGQPKFKRRGLEVSTLLYEDGKAIRVDTVTEAVEKRVKQDFGMSPQSPGKMVKKPVEVQTSYIHIPKLGAVRVAYLDKRWKDTPIKVLKLCRCPDGFFIQLTGNVQEKPLKPSARKAGLALPQTQGVLYVDDKGKNVEVCSEDIKLLLRLEKLQQRLSQQVYLSNRWKKTKNKIAQVHRKLALRGRNHNHKLSTFVVRKFGEIAVQEVKAGTISHPEPVVASVEPTHYDPNGATQVSIINQRRTQQRTGQFVMLVKQKSKTAGRQVTIVKPPSKNKSKKTDNREMTPVKIAVSIRPK